MPEPNANTGYVSDKTETKGGSTGTGGPTSGEYVMPETDVWGTADKVKTGNYSKTENPYPDPDKPKTSAEQHVAAPSRISPVWLAVAAAGALFLLRPSDP